MSAPRLHSVVHSLGDRCSSLSISAEREVPSPICEGGGNNNSRFVVGSTYAATWIGSFRLYNSPLSEAQVLIYQMRKLKLHSCKATGLGFEPMGTNWRTHTLNHHAASCSQVQSPGLLLSPTPFIQSSPQSNSVVGFEICT